MSGFSARAFGWRHAIAPRSNLTFLNARDTRTRDIAVDRDLGVAALNTIFVRPAGYWQHLEQVITAEVDAALAENDDARRPLVTYLRTPELTARTECDRRETIQLIASGRRVLGDESNIGPVAAPFPRLRQIAP